MSTLKTFMLLLMFGMTFLVLSRTLNDAEQDIQSYSILIPDQPDSAVLPDSDQISETSTSYDDLGRSHYKIDCSTLSSSVNRYLTKFSFDPTANPAFYIEPFKGFNAYLRI